MFSHRPASPTALGVDVGLTKGLDLVLLDAGRQIRAVRRRLPHSDFRDLVREWQPDVVAIDSPPAWALDGPRATEVEVQKLGIRLYLTPQEASRSIHGFHDWMAAGIDAFRAIADQYPLFSGGDVHSTALEVFPHASAVVFAGGLIPSGQKKHAWRREVLASMGVAPDLLTSPDLVDAALAALTGIYAIEGNACWRGNPAEGRIVLPCREDSLPPRFRPLPA